MLEALCSVSLALALVSVLLGYRLHVAVRTLRLLRSPIISKHEDQPAERARSPQMYLHACAQRLGVSTQTLKDLGFRTAPVATAAGGAYSLVTPAVPSDIESLAREAMGEIAVEVRAVGGRVQVPPTSWRWIARAVERGRKSMNPPTESQAWKRSQIP